MESTRASEALLRLLSDLLITVGVLLLAASGIYYGYVLYSEYQIAHFGINERLDVAAFAPPAVAPELWEEPPLFSPPGPVQADQPTTRPSAAQVRIPSINVDSRIVELGTTFDEKGVLVWETPKNAVGHHLGTANPGEKGNMVLSGHISSPVKQEGNVFSRLPDVKLGALVEVDTSEGTYTYQVVSRQVVEPTEISVMDPTPTPVLTLITCYPNFVYSHRLVLTAEPVGFQAFEG